MARSLFNLILCSAALTLSALAFADAGAPPASVRSSTTTTTTSSTAAPATVVSAKTLNLGSSKLLGKRVLFNGKVDRILGPGAYIMTDASGPNKPSHRILVLTAGQGMAVPSAGGNGKHQQAGTASSSFKEGQKVQVQGKVEELHVTNEVERFSPRTDRETINETATRMPVLVTRAADIHTE